MNAFERIEMKLLQNLKLTGLAALMMVGIAGCNQPGPAQSEGKKIDLAAAVAAEKASSAIEDARITAKVETAFFSASNLKILQIGITTAQGVVTLRGSVDTQENSDRAKALAASVAGVKEVENRLVIQLDGDGLADASTPEYR